MTNGNKRVVELLKVEIIQSADDTNVDVVRPNEYTAGGKMNLRGTDDLLQQREQERLTFLN